MEEPDTLMSCWRVVNEYTVYHLRATKFELVGFEGWRTPLL